MVGIWGMSEELGPVYFGLGEEHPFLGRAMAQDRPYGDSTASEIDVAVRRLVDGAHDRAVKLLQGHRGQLDTMARTLLRKESLTAEEVQEIVAENEPVPVQAVGD
jgi:cell division protease FtsH